MTLAIPGLPVEPFAEPLIISVNNRFVRFAFYYTYIWELFRALEVAEVDELQKRACRLLADLNVPPSEREDVFQDAYVSVLSSKIELDRERWQGPWSYFRTVVLNTVNHKRRRWVREHAALPRVSFEVFTLAVIPSVGDSAPFEVARANFREVVILAIGDRLHGKAHQIALADVMEGIVETAVLAARLNLKPSYVRKLRERYRKVLQCDPRVVAAAARLEAEQLSAEQLRCVLRPDPKPDIDLDRGGSVRTTMVDPAEIDRLVSFFVAAGVCPDNALVLATKLERARRILSETNPSDCASFGSVSSGRPTTRTGHRNIRGIVNHWDERESRAFSLENGRRSSGCLSSGARFSSRFVSRFMSQRATGKHAAHQTLLGLLQGRSR